MCVYVRTRVQTILYTWRSEDKLTVGPSLQHVGEGYPSLFMADHCGQLPRSLPVSASHLTADSGSRVYCQDELLHWTLLL